MKSPRKPGRPRGPKKAPELHPGTLATLAGRFTIGQGAPPATGSQTARALAATGSTLEPRLVELCFRIEATRGKPLLAELHHEETERFGRVARVAAAVGDVAFFRQAAECMEKAARCAGVPVRLLVLEAWMEARKAGNPPLLADVRAGVKYRLGRIDPDSASGELSVILGDIGEDTLRDHLQALGLRTVSRRSGKN
jgi:hypothetical protein